MAEEKKDSGTKRLGDQELGDFLTRLASASPIPGGGGASALSGACGVCLGMMVGNLTTGKKRYADFEERLGEIMKELSVLKEDFMRLAERDEEVFLPLSKAYGLPKETEEQRLEKDRIMEKCLHEASLVPLEIMETAVKALLLVEELAERGSRIAVSDAGVSAEFLNTAVLGGAMNVIINVKAMKDRDFAEKTKEKFLSLKKEGAERAEKIYCMVEKSLES